MDIYTTIAICGAVLALWDVGRRWAGRMSEADQQSLLEAWRATNEATVGHWRASTDQVEANVKSIEVLVSEVNKLKSDLGGMAAFGQSPLQQRRQQGGQR